jgi:hydroxymethylpyrimidine pyrophosphatase-like HAD family hydrolase
MKSSNIKKPKKKYKALIVDVDGTLVPNKREGMPSKKVTDSIAKASKILHVGVATSRPYFILTHIVDHLKLSGPSIAVGGAQIIDTTSKKIIFEQQLLIQDVMEISKHAETLSIPIYIPGNNKEEILSKKNIHQKTTQLWTQGFRLEEADKFINELSHISTVSFHKIPSWKNGKIDIIGYSGFSTG